MTSDPAPPVTGRAARLLLLALAACCGGLLWSLPPAAGATEPATGVAGVWPLAPEPPVVRGFDPPDDPWTAGHRGVDLLGRPGQPVRSALPGRVAWSGALAGRGVVVVDHGTTRTTYEPLDARAPVGVVVAAGDRIGRLATLGSHCLPRTCLHWGWIEDQTYLDPLRLVGGGPVRLLPLWSAADPPVALGTSSWPARVGTGHWPPAPRAAAPYAAWRPVAAAVLGPLAQARGWACW